MFKTNFINSQSRFLSGKKIILLFCVILFSGILSAQPGSWSEQNSGVTAELTSVWCVDASNVWVCGYSGTVLKSANGGTNWTNLTGNGIPTTVSLINICGFPYDNTNALTAGYFGSDTWVWKTTNGGTNWTQVFSQTGGFINAVWMTSATNGFMTGNPVGGRWSLWKTTNGGTNWDSTGLYLAQVGTETGYNNSMIYKPPYIWFGTNNSKIYYSSNNGTNWITQVTTDEVNSNAIWFHSIAQSGVGLFGGTNLYQTTNNGINWIALTSLGSGNFGGITSTPLLTVVDNLVQPAWYVRSTNLIYYSANFGANWGIDYTNPTTTSYYRHISMAYPGRGIWAVGTLGKITYHTALVDIENIGLETPGNYSLYQNYPNPFNPATKIRFDIKKEYRSQESEVKLSIYDILGRKIEDLVNEKLQPGTYEVTFDGSNLPSGIYFYRMQSGDYISTMKMLLIK
jgi:photosystem II stability/assembly factor-like uncharacterized protein